MTGPLIDATNIDGFLNVDQNFGLQAPLV